MSVKNWKPNRPYNELPPLPPRVEIESKAILKACITARAALAELKQAAELNPNQGVLINTLPLLEAGASSEIENIVTTTDKLFEHMRNEAQADPATKEALRYSHAALEGFKTLSKYPLTTHHSHGRADLHSHQSGRDERTSNTRHGTKKHRNR